MAARNRWFGVRSEWDYSSLRQKAKVQRRKSEGRAKGGGRSGASRLKNLKNKGLKWLREINETKSIKVLLADGKGKC